jgi:hypothetical protein
MGKIININKYSRGLSKSEALEILDFVKDYVTKKELDDIIEKSKILY